jgi:hypothetical protein
MKKHLASTEGGAIDLELNRPAVKHSSATRREGAGSGAAAATVLDLCDECNLYAQSEKAGRIVLSAARAAFLAPQRNRERTEKA